MAPHKKNEMLLVKRSGKSSRNCGSHDHMANHKYDLAHRWRLDEPQSTRHLRTAAVLKQTLAAGYTTIRDAAGLDAGFKRAIEDRSIAQASGVAAIGKRPLPEIQKTYLAITWGIPEDGVIDLPLERDPSNSLRVKMRVIKGGLESRTHVTVLERAGAYALVSCELLTGRQHQIRIHLSSVGCPVVGDKLYGPDERMLARAADQELSDEDRSRLELPRQALHAHRYRMNHAMTGEPLDLVSPLPADLTEFWKTKLAESEQ